MKKKLNRLTLNKETLMRLQDSQMKSLVGGGQDAITISSTNAYTCSTCPGTLDCTTTEIPAAASCCKKTCNAADLINPASPNWGL